MRAPSLSKKTTSLWLAVIVTAGASACGVNGHIESLDKNSEAMAQNTDRMAREIEIDRQYIRQLSDSLKQLSQLVGSMTEKFLAPAPAGKTADLGDVLAAPPLASPQNPEQKSGKKLDKPVKIARRAVK